MPFQTAAIGTGWLPGPMPAALSEIAVDASAQRQPHADRADGPPEVGADPDAALMQAVGRGDEAALRQLIERWQQPLIQYFYRSTRSLQTAEDFAQMLFVKLYRAAPRYEPKARFSTYLFAIARRILINEYRKRERRPVDYADPAELTASTSGRAPLELMEIEEAFEQALAGLPENQRTALLLWKQEQLSYLEIAEAMAASETAVKTWIFRARKALKAELKPFVS
jgi:RNA polymerase sigma-70 factor (ECF subfamily)